MAYRYRRSRYGYNDYYDDSSSSSDSSSSDGSEADTMENIVYLYHNTGYEAMNAIKHQRRLKGSSNDRPEDQPLARSGIKGTWFCATLYDGQLPDWSPYMYGPQRIALRCRKLLPRFQDPQLFYESSSKKGNKVYERLVLVDAHRHRDEYRWCRHNLTSLDITDNRYLVLDDEDHVYKCAENFSPRYIWITVLVVGDIDLRGLSPRYSVVSCD